MKILAFAGSSSKNSINKSLVSFALEQMKSENKTLLDLNDFELPLYSIDLEKELGLPENLLHFAQHIEAAECIVLSLAEHNGTYTAVFKNLFDWLTRNKSSCFEGKKMILLSTSNGLRGGRGVMNAALDRFPQHGPEILGHLCVPNFKENFNQELGITDAALKEEFFNLMNLVK